MMIRLMVVEPRIAAIPLPRQASRYHGASRSQTGVPVTTVRNGMAYPRADYSETADELVFRLDVPGATKDDISVDYDSRQLRITWQKKPESSRYVSRESVTGTFTRTFALPDSVEIERVTAEVKNGVMTIRAPKRTEPDRRQIEVS